jgi:DNA-binding MarR family transcriptional regulator
MVTKRARGEASIAMDQTEETLGQAHAAASLLLALTRHLVAVDRDPAGQLPLAQLRVCGMLYGGARQMSALGRELGVSLSAMTQIADRLERARLVKRIAEGNDRRVRCLQLTPRGQRMMQLREAARVGRVLTALEHLAPNARSEVVGALETLVDACDATRGQDGQSVRKVGRRPTKCASVP